MKTAAEDSSAWIPLRAEEHWFNAEQTRLSRLTTVTGTGAAKMTMAAALARVVCCLAALMVLLLFLLNQDVLIPEIHWAAVTALTSFT